MPPFKVGYRKSHLASKWKAIAKKLLKRSASKYSVFKPKRIKYLRKKAYKRRY